MNTLKDTIFPLVEYSATIRAEDIPDNVMTKSADLFQDTIGCILAGTTALGIKELREMLLSFGGNPQATIFGYGDKTSAPNAALINAAMGHARDFDDTHDSAINHGCVTIVPALMALAETISSQKTLLPFGIKSKKITGQEFIAALAVGLDVANRIGIAFIPYLHTGWLPTTLWGPFGCAAACGRLLGLDTEKMSHAYGLAYSLSHGNRQALVDGKLAKRMQPGFSAMSSVQAVFMASGGITGAQNIIDGDFGIPALYTSGQVDKNSLTENLGQHFETLNISIKPYPSCRCSHPVIDAVKILKNDYSIDWQEIEKGTVFLPPQGMGQIGAPFKIRDNPTVDAQFSAQYTAALTFMKGHVCLEDFEPENILKRKDISDFALNFTSIEFEKDAPGLIPVEVALVLKNGRDVRVRIDVPKGSPENPLTKEEKEFKFQDCLNNCVKHYSIEEKEKILQNLTNILEIKGLSEIII